MKLKGHELNQSSTIQDLVKNLVGQAQAITSKIEGVRPPDPAHKERAQQMIDQVGKHRGRPLYYPYLGTGAGRGPYVELEDGSVKLDLINGIGIHIMGHSHPKMIEASVQGALQDIVMQGHLEMNTEYLKFNELMLDLAGRKSRLKTCWISTCGTMANENALKAARQKNTPARMTLAFHHGFAGRSTMMAEITDNPDYRVGLPVYNEVLRLPFYDSKRPSESTAEAVAALKKHIDQHPKNIAAFWFEPIMGEGGFYAAPREFYAPLFEICKQNGIAVWADEVQTFCRTGQLFAFETLNIGEYIDICTIAKTAKCGATLFSPEYNPKPGLIAGTFAASSGSLAAGTAVIRELTEGGYFGPQGKIQKIHDQFVVGLNKLNETNCKGLISEISGLGLMIAFTPYDGGKDKTNALLKCMFNNGLIAFSAGHGPYRIRFLIPAIMTSHDIDTALEIVAKSLIETKDWKPATP
jgi:4-aminobutyrate aminotransferase-like enzyme